jgi:hypothetical protein
MIKARLFRFAVGAAFVLFAVMTIASMLPDGMADGAD